MAGFFYHLGRRVAPKVRKGAWLWQSIAGSEEDSIRAERRVGRDLLEAWQSLKPLRVPEGPETGRIATVRDRLTAKLRNKARRFDVYLMDVEELNAFALPGGFVVITSPLFQLLTHDESELAFVVGHEFGHIVLGHAFDRLMASTAASLFSRVAPAPGALRGWVRTAGMRLFNSAYSQTHELDADAFGTRLARAAGFDPAGAASALRRLHSESDTQAPCAFLSSHPPLDERIRHIRSTLREQ